MRARRLVLLIFAAALTWPAGAEVAPAPGAVQAPRGTAMLAGQVVDATTGASVPDAIVQLTMPSQMVGDARVAPSQPPPGGRVMADPEGRFFFDGLPAGEYWLGASKDGYASGSYRQRRAGEQGERIRLADREARIDLRLPVWKHGVIAGTVLDEAGEPVVGVAVRALVQRIVAGRPQYGTVGYLVPGATTDDRGRFRIARVEPGTYVLVAPWTQTSVPVSVAAGLSSLTLRTELGRAGVSSARAPSFGDPRTQQIDDILLLTAGGVLIPPPPSADGRLQVYRTTYYPAAATAAEATPIRMEAGAERADLTITLVPAPAVRVSGRLVTANGGAPPPITLRLAGAPARDVVTPSLGSSDPAAVGFETATGFSETGGRFTFLGVPPGEYLLAHANTFLIAEVREGRPAYWVSQRISVGDADVTDLVVTAHRAIQIEGRVEFRGWAGPPALPPGFLAASVALETASGEPGGVAASADRASLAFLMAAPGGRYMVRTYGSAGWVVQSVTLDGKDVTDRPFDLNADARSMVVTYTDRPTRVAGTVKDPAGRASASAIVVAFPIDRERWTGHGASPRHLRSAYTTPDGEFAIDHLPPGEYHVIAIDEAGSDHWQDPERLGALAAQATRLTVAAGDSAKTLALTLRTVR